ncbi:hypothetical protein AJ80_09529 [Polytolypa hystricis UAMH7299]|uniref:Uncharacterized protein n=1 Tax=Polytolypa hystricis (strain UAMH7299) TaxID=1447883 RepID=A0A2B7WPG8_POLH7|nr:hypothetical protein AJ80_09529 [Polytolypa hystricis UAMH7299]
MDMKKCEKGNTENFTADQLSSPAKQMKDRPSSPAKLVKPSTPPNIRTNDLSPTVHEHPASADPLLTPPSKGSGEEQTLARVGREQEQTILECPRMEDMTYEELMEYARKTGWKPPCRVRKPGPLQITEFDIEEMVYGSAEE